MNILISAWGSTGEHVPVAALCQMLSTQHDVRVLASEAHRDIHAVPPTHFHPLQSISLAEHAKLRLHVSGEIVRCCIDPLACGQFAAATDVIKRHAIDVVLASWITPGVIAAAQSLGVRVVPLHLYPLPVMAEDDFPVFTRWPRLTRKHRYPARAPHLKRAILRHFRTLSPRLLELRLAHGLADDGGLLPGAGGAGLALFPRSLLRAATNHVFVPLPQAPAHALPPAIMNFISSGTPPVLIFLGSLARLRAGILHQIESHLTAMSERCIVVWGAEMAPVFKSPMVLELGLFPIASLLPHVKAMIHHGGINTITAALHSAKPSLALPFFGDQLDNAWRLSDLGAGLMIRDRTVSDENLRRALRRLLKDDFAIHAGLAPASAGLPDAALRMIEDGKSLAPAPPGL